jgi:hypothetical protein
MKEKEKMKTKTIGVIASIVVLAGTLASSVLASDDGVLEKEEMGNNYCHMKFRAIKDGTLAGNDPQLKDASSGDIIDFYGPCDESPTGKDQVEAQRLDESRHRQLGYVD